MDRQNLILLYMAVYSCSFQFPENLFTGEKFHPEKLTH